MRVSQGITYGLSALYRILTKQIHIVEGVMEEKEKREITEIRKGGGGVIASILFKTQFFCVVGYEGQEALIIFPANVGYSIVAGKEYPEFSDKPARAIVATDKQLLVYTEEVEPDLYIVSAWGHVDELDSAEMQIEFRSVARTRPLRTPRRTPRVGAGRDYVKVIEVSQP